VRFSSSLKTVASVPVLGVRAGYFAALTELLLSPVWFSSLGHSESSTLTTAIDRSIDFVCGQSALREFGVNHCR
jgi:hypothetical protein